MKLEDIKRTMLVDERMTPRCREIVMKLVAVAEAAKAHKMLDDKRWETGIQPDGLYDAWKKYGEALAALESD